MKSASTVRWYIAASALMALIVNMVAISVTELAYFLPLLGVMSIPANIYCHRVAQQYGGWSSKLGKSLHLINIGIVMFNVVGTIAFFWYITCAEWPIFSCGRVYGQNDPSFWSDLLFDMRFICFGLGLFLFSSMLNIRGNDFLRWIWVPVLLVAFNLFLALPDPGLELIVKNYDWTRDEYLNISEWMGNAVISSWAIVLASNARKAAGGMFFRPVVLIIAALVCFMIGDIMHAPAIVDQAKFDVSEGNAPIGMGMLLLIIAFTQFGKIGESCNEELAA